MLFCYIQMWIDNKHWIVQCPRFLQVKSWSSNKRRCLMNLLKIEAYDNQDQWCILRFFLTQCHVYFGVGQQHIKFFFQIAVHMKSLIIALLALSRQYIFNQFSGIFLFQVARSLLIGNAMLYNRKFLMTQLYYD